MKSEALAPRPGARGTAARLSTVALASGLVWLAACSTSSGGGRLPTAAEMATPAPSPDPRVGLEPGRVDSTRRVLERAEETIWNLRLVSNTPTPEGFVGVTNSDLAFIGNQVIQGNYNGFIIWDVSNPARPRMTRSHVCPASQSDVSIFRNLLFVSGEGLGGRVDCGAQGVQDTVSTDRLRGIRIFDATDMANPRYIANVQTCRGSHTHTVVTDPRDAQNVYIYVSGSAGVRSPRELPGCSALAPSEDPSSALFRIEVIRVPLANPQMAAIVSSPRIFQDLPAPPRHADPPDPDRPQRPPPPGAVVARPQGPPPQRTGPSQCHDITVYPEIGLAGGACGGYGLLLDISDVANPRRLFAAADSNFSFWHSATFSNDGSKVLFTDEWGGGGSPRCRSTDKYEWGANALFTIENRRNLRFESYYKMPAAQTQLENCVAHNGSLIPIPGRDVMVQGWYQGGISIFDWTDVKNPKEIAFHDRGPLDSQRLASAGSWSVYWYNGHMYSSEIARGLDVFELVPSPYLTQNEIDAAKTVRYEYFNAQEQPKIVWPASFALARAYLDQLSRSGGLAAERLTAVQSELARLEGQSGQQRQSGLTQLATHLDADAQGSRDQAKVRLLAGAVRELANTQN